MNVDKKHQHILVIRFSAMGDVAMTVPIVWAVAHQYPEVRITVLSRAFARPFFENLAPNVNFMEADLKGEYHGIKGLNSLYRRLTAKQFTHVADLHSVLRSKYLRMRFNIGHFKVQHIDKHRKMRRQLVSHENKVRQQLPTSFENYVEVFAKLGFPIERNDFKSIFPAEGGNLHSLPEQIGLKREGEKWIGIAPFAAHKGKIYPKEQMQEVVRQLTERYPKARIFLFGRGKEEEETFPKWAQQMPQCTCVSWHLDGIEQELILMSHLDVMLSMDSANMHMASLTGTPVVSVWGATHPMAGFLGWHQNVNNAVQIEMDCRPCSIYGQKPCIHGDYRCMTGIKPEMIVERITNIINS
jgi:ADP-heptose:LPS heptosyltransferase